VIYGNKKVLTRICCNTSTDAACLKSISQSFASGAYRQKKSSAQDR